MSDLFFFFFCSQLVDRCLVAFQTSLRTETMHAENVRTLQLSNTGGPAMSDRRIIA